MTYGSRNFRGVFLLGLFLLIYPVCVRAQFMGRQTGCYNSEIVANPNRPTVANPADITQYGVLELEYGWDRGWLGAGARQSDLVGLLKFGLLCDVELRWNTTNLIALNDEDGNRHGFGDNWFGPQVRIYRQTAHVPSLAFSYAFKVSTASTHKGLGSGHFDHQFTFLASKDLVGTHFDFNASSFLIGRDNASGFDRNFQFNLALSHPLKSKLAVTGEFYGNTELNADTPGFASMLWALTYAISPRLVIDGGIETGLTPGTPQKRVFAGLTYSIANIYSAVKHRRPANGNSKPPDSRR
jgi:hypothetical protein